ncbi:MAG: helix-turn-helix transcriptional regulator [Actinobacteria bacterium]|nr:helix-turn-helix transcriptional regulator [Actinomycetota bacterium]
MSGPSLVARPGDLLEREREVERLSAAIEQAVGGHGTSVHVEGPAGIGKTGLLGVARTLACEHGLTVLATSGGELEREFSYGIVRSLFEHRLLNAPASERAELLSGSAASAAPAVGLDGPTTPAVEAGGSVLRGLYRLTANLSSRGPLALVVDDAHWADPASLRFLAYLAARIGDLPIVLVTAARPREPQTERALLEQLVATAGPELLQPAALSAEATARVVGVRLDREVDDEVAAACHEVTGGNPYLLRELAAAIRVDGSDLPPDANRVRDLGPSTVSRALIRRLDAMPAAAGAIAAAVAILGNDVELHRAASFAEVDPDEAAAAIDALADAEILDAELPLNFVHPIVRSAVYADLGPGRRAAAHARAARLLLEDGAVAERIASHVIQGAPAGDRRLVAVLRQAAAEAVSRGAPEAALPYLRRAIEEVGEARVDGELLYELGAIEYVVGERPEEAASHLRAAILAIDDDERRAEAWLTLARTTMTHFDVATAVAVLEEALADLPDLTGEARVRLEVELTCLGVTGAETFEPTAARIAARAPAGDATLAERLALCNQAYLTGQAGRDLERTVALGRRAVAGGELVAGEGAESNAVMQVLYVMCFADLLDEVRSHLDAGLELAAARGSSWGFAAASGCRGSVNYLAGDLIAAEADCRQAIEVAGSPPFALPFISAVLALTLLERGELEEAEAVVADAGCGPELPAVVHMDILLWARGRVRAARGRDREALADLLAFGERCARVGAANPAIWWRADAALVLARLGEHERAREMAGEQLCRARAWGAPSAIGRALAAQATVLGGDDGPDLLREAIDALEASPARLDRARAEVDLGAAVRRSGRRREARKHLREGLEAARRCGATALVERAHRELVTAGARPRRLMFSGLEALTASERRVAEMASGGLSNREIAQTLFVTAKTVENHLGRAYAKLGIHSREELPGALAPDPASS